MTQMDLLSQPLQPRRVVVAAPPPAPPALPLTVRVSGWERRVAGSAHRGNIRVLVAANHTGIVVETFSDPSSGRAFLHKDGTVQEVEHVDSWFGRTLIVNVPQAEALHLKWRLVPINEGGYGSRLFRFAEVNGPGQPFPGLVATA